jgi:hypothetical protein
MTVYVVMRNDYPDSVFASRKAAEVYVARQEHVCPDTLRTIYWAVRAFALRDV